MGMWSLILLGLKLIHVKGAPGGVHMIFFSTLGYYCSGDGFSLDCQLDPQEQNLQFN